MVRTVGRPVYHIGWPEWSDDGKFIYFTIPSFETQRHYLRVRVSNHSLEKIADMHVPNGNTGFARWIGKDPDGTPILLRNLSFEEIYALDVELP